MTRCLVVASRVDVGRSLAESLSASGFEVDVGSKSEEITQALNEHLPGFMVVDFHDQLGLRMLALVESLRLRIPVLALRKSTVEAHPLPLPLSPFLRLHGLSSGEHEWRSQVGEALGSKTRMPEDGMMFHGSDYVQLSVLNELSVVLHGRLDEGQDVHVEIVGGDVWNAFAGAAEGEVAFEEILTRSPLEVDVNPLISVPSGRQIRRSGWDLLDVCARRIMKAGSSLALGTRPILLSEVREIVENEGASEPEAETFEELVELGFAKALARNYRDAAEAFERALELRPEDTRVKFNLGKVRRRLEE